MRDPGRESVTVAVFRSATSRLVEANMQVLPPLAAWPGWFDLPVFFVMLVLYTAAPVVASIWLFRRRTSDDALASRDSAVMG